METTFITIHDLSPNATLLYSSESIIDILGYSPDDVLHKSCWDFFHPDELPVALAKHAQGVEMDKAAMLSYCQMKGKDGSWIGCEVVFTVVYDVMVGCTSIYRRGLKSQSRAVEAPAIRKLFSTSPRDPRYHMLSHLSSKFSRSLPTSDIHERRAALFLNRYTRTLTIMHATDGLADLLGISGEELRGKSFYYCIQENCLKDAVRCLENAKTNDSIAYLRFWYRDPRQEDTQTTNHQANGSTQDDDSVMEDAVTSDEEYQAARGRINGADHHLPPDLRDADSTRVPSEPISSSDSMEPVQQPADRSYLNVPSLETRTSSDDSSNAYSHEAIFGEPETRDSSASSLSASPSSWDAMLGDRRHSQQPVELEAVVSCTSDGLVVCLRQAAPFFAEAPSPQPVQQGVDQGYENGLFAVPWAREPMLPPVQQRPQGSHSAFAPSLTPAQAYHQPIQQIAKPAQSDFMNSIRDCAVFAWALVGINGSLADHGSGRPRGESQPSSGLPVWQPEAAQESHSRQDFQAHPPSTAAGLQSDFHASRPSPASVAVGSNSVTHEPPQSSYRSSPKSYRKSSKSHRPAETMNGILQDRASGRCHDSPAAPSHLVDGIDGAFDSNHQRDPFSPQGDSHMVDGIGGVDVVDGTGDHQRDSISPERSRHGDMETPPSEFRLGDAGAGRAPISKLMNSSRSPDYLSQWHQGVTQESNPYSDSHQTSGYNR